MNWSEKNERRRLARQGVTRAAYKEARALRRRCPDGAFGGANERWFNRCVIGTLGEPRDEKDEA